MIGTMPEGPGCTVVLVGIRAILTVGASRFDSRIATVSPCENEAAEYFSSNEVEESWSEEKNRTRCDLINRKHSTGLSPREAQELERLQSLMLRHRQRTVPLPLDDARRLYKELISGGTFLSLSTTP